VHIRARHGHQGDAATAGKNDPPPGDEHPTWPVNHGRIIDVVQLGPLRNQKVPAGGRIVKVLGDLGDQHFRQFGIGARDHDAGSGRAGLEFAFPPDLSDSGESRRRLSPRSKKPSLSLSAAES
jgi:hypothetical protein